MAIDFTPLTPSIGIEAKGVDLREPLGDNAFKSLYQAFCQHSVLLVRDQQLSPAQHVAFARRFGALESHVLAENMLAAQPEIFVVSNVKEDGKYLGRATAGWFWHSDFSYQAVPAQASVMHAIEVPEAGGDTLFAATGAAFEALSPPVRDFLERLEAVHDFRHGSSRYGNQLNTEQKITEDHFAARPPATHPVVHSHPDTGRKHIFAIPGYTERIAGLSTLESDTVLDFIERHVSQPQFVYRHHWRPGDVLCWDNRGCWHQAVGDYDDNARRRMHRVTVKGAPLIAANAA